MSFTAAGAPPAPHHTSTQRPSARLKFLHDTQAELNQACRDMGDAFQRLHNASQRLHNCLVAAIAFPDDSCSSSSSPSSLLLPGSTSITANNVSDELTSIKEAEMHIIKALMEGSEQALATLCEQLNERADECMRLQHDQATFASIASLRLCLADLIGLILKCTAKFTPVYSYFLNSLKSRVENVRRLLPGAALRNEFYENRNSSANYYSTSPQQQQAKVNANQQTTQSTSSWRQPNNHQHHHYNNQQQHSPRAAYDFPSPAPLPPPPMAPYNNSNALSYGNSRHSGNSNNYEQQQQQQQQQSGWPPSSSYRNRTSAPPPPRASSSPPPSSALRDLEIVNSVGSIGGGGGMGGSTPSIDRF